MRSILERAGGSVNQRGETCRFRQHRPRPQIENATIGRQEVGNPGILHTLTIREPSQIGPVSVGREMNFPTTDGVFRQNTYSHDTFVHVQRITERIAQVQSLITRTRVAQVVCLGVSTVVCHPSVISHMWPHLSQSISSRPVFRPPSPSLSCPSELDQENPARFTAEWRIHKICISHSVL